MFDRLLALCTATEPPALPHDWWMAWGLSPITVLPMLGLLAWCIAAPRVSGLPAGPARAWRLVGMTLLAVALVSPLCRLAATLAVAHMAQLMLLVLGSALLAHGWRSVPAPVRAASSLIAATFCHGTLLWLWHLPVVYEAVLVTPMVHVGALAALVASALWFWRAALGRLKDDPFSAAFALLATMAHTGLLGALLTFAGEPLYPLQAAGARAWGLTPLEDQQLAGLLMWVPGGLAYLLATLALLSRVLSGNELAPSRD